MDNKVQVLTAPVPGERRELMNPELLLIKEGVPFISGRRTKGNKGNTMRPMPSVPRKCQPWRSLLLAKHVPPVKPNEDAGLSYIKNACCENPSQNRICHQAIGHEGATCSAFSLFDQEKLSVVHDSVFYETSSYGFKGPRAFFIFVRKVLRRSSEIKRRLLRVLLALELSYLLIWPSGHGLMSKLAFQRMGPHTTYIVQMGD